MRKWNDVKPKNMVISVGDIIEIDAKKDKENPKDLRHIIRKGIVTNVYRSFFTVKFERADGSYRTESFKMDDITTGYIRVL